MHGIDGIYWVESNSMDANEDLTIPRFGNGKLLNRDVLGCGSENEGIHLVGYFWQLVKLREQTNKQHLIVKITWNKSMKLPRGDGQIEETTEYC
jgi:hypothetical protein